MFGVIVGIARLHIKAPTTYESFGVAKLLRQCVVQEFSQWRVGLHKIETRNYSNWRSFVPKKWSSTKQTYGQIYYTRPILSTRPSIFQNSRNAFRQMEFNTNVKNNVMLYRFEKPYMFKLATAFAVFVLVGCFAMADVVYKVLCKGLWVPDKSLKTRLIEHILPLTAILTGLLGGPLIAGFIAALTIRSIKYIILRKGGQEMTMVTYHPFKKDVVRTVPLKNVSSLTTRDGLKTYIPIKIKGTRWYFMCDKNGHFVNPDLFDYTVGIKRFE